MCGFVGLIQARGVEADVVPSLVLGLQAVQHRGQDAAGIATWDRSDRIRLYKDVGRVSEVFTDEAIRALPGRAGVGHVRYPTGGGATRNDAQPFMTRRPSIALAHNGNLTNLAEIRRHLAIRGMRAVSLCDSESILLALADELQQQQLVGHSTEDLVVAVRRTMQRLRGGYSVVALAEIDGELTLATFRDPHGIRPAVYGRTPGGGWAVASESVSLDVNDARLEGEVPPGGLVLLRPGGEPVVVEILHEAQRHCIFEDIYFARPDSVMAGSRVYARRWAFGERLAREWQARGLEADVVVAVPDTSRPAAQAMAERLGLPYREGFIKNRYSGRTFIMPDQATREAAMRLKINLIDEIFRDQRVVIVDDSIVRGTTMRRLVQMVRQHDPREIHVAIFSPAVRHPCFYGIDMPSQYELVAHGPEQGSALEARLAIAFGADTVAFLSEEGLLEVAGAEICAACFTGIYPIEVNEEERGDIVRDRRPHIVADAAALTFE